MAYVIITLKVMPESPEISLTKLKDKVKEEIEKFGGVVGKIEEEPIGFGLSALIFRFNSPETKSNLDPLEEAIKKIDGVSNCEVIGVTRAFG